MDTTYHLLWVLYQYCSDWLEDDFNDRYTGRTQFNSDARSIMFLQNEGYVEITDGKFPDTKFISFRITDKGLIKMGIIRPYELLVDDKPEI